MLAFTSERTFDHPAQALLQKPRCKVEGQPIEFLSVSENDVGWITGDIEGLERAVVVLPPHRRGIAMVFQDLALWPNLSVLENVLLGLGGTECSKAERAARATDALALCGIPDLADRKPGTLSGGQQQRIALARSLAVRPAFLFLDEPFPGLDPVIKAKLLREIAALAGDHAFTIVLVTHDPFEGPSSARRGCCSKAAAQQSEANWPISYASRRRRFSGASGNACQPVEKVGRAANGPWALRLRCEILTKSPDFASGSAP